MNLAVRSVSHNFEYENINNDRFQLYRQQSDVVRHSFAEDVHDGLRNTTKKLLPKYFYDDIGSELFEQITTTPEYYPTRTERQILENSMNEIKSICQDIKVISELGSGSSEKTKIILESFLSEKHELTYIPIDVSDILVTSSERLLSRYHDLDITGIVAEYEPGLSLLSGFDNYAKLLIFLGSSIGNYNREEAGDLLKSISDSMGERDFALIGFDLIKDNNILTQAYNDSQGITEAFNLNILSRINRELDGNFNLENYRHKAFYNSIASRIEMHLVSQKDQQVFIKSLNRNYEFAKGESIHTENSHKFTDQSIAEMAASSGLNVVKTWKDSNNYFALTLFSLS
jgi:L-histidine Nalpha-methyltransferase